MAFRRGWLMGLVGCAIVVSAVAPLARQAPGSAALSADALFDAGKVWTVHLTLTAEAFAKLTPPLAPAPPQVMPAAPPSPAPAPPMQMTVPDVLPPEMLRMFSTSFIGREGGRNGISAARNNIEFEYVHAAFEMEGVRFADVAVRAKGNGSYTPVPRFPKPSLKIDFNKFVKGQAVGGVSTINLHNNITDASWMNEVLAYRLYRDAGVPAPRTSWAKVYVSVPGGVTRKYLGLYSVVENIDDDFIQSRLKVEGGPLLKPISTVPFLFLSRNWSDYNQIYDPKTDLTPAEQQRIIDICDMVTNSTDQIYASRVGEILDVPAFAKYMAVVAWLANPDSILFQGQNYYVHVHPTTGRMTFFPWDQDHSFGQFVPFRTPQSQQQLDIAKPWIERFAGAPFAKQLEMKLLSRTFALPAFRQAYIAELRRLTSTLAQPERLMTQVDELGAFLAPHVAEEPKDGRVMAFAESLGETEFRRPINQNVTVVPIKTFVKARHASVTAQLAKLP